MKIFLIGMPGSGKSSLGRQLADSLSLPFIDLDEIITAKENRDIPEIFATQGEDYFRIKERKALHGINDVYEEFVMATGGGAPCFFDNMAYINKNGTSIFIDVEPRVIANRLTEEDLEERPLFSNVERDDLEKELITKLEKRKPYYLQAQYTVRGSDLRAENLLDFIKNKE